MVGRLLHDRNRLLAICKWLVAIGRSADAVTIADLARRDSPSTAASTSTSPRQR